MHGIYVKKEKSVTNSYINFGNGLLNVYVRNTATLTFIFLFLIYFGRGNNTMHVKSCTKTVRNFVNKSPYLPRARTKRISAGDIVNHSMHKFLTVIA